MAIRTVSWSHEFNEMLLGLLLFHDARIYHVPAFLFVKWILKCCHEMLKPQTNERSVFEKGFLLSSSFSSHSSFSFSS